MIESDRVHIATAIHSDRRPGKTDLNVAVVGAGYVSRHHLAALRRVPGVKVTAVVDVDTNAAAAAAAHFGVPRACADLRELVNTDLDAVHVLTPPSTHCALALKALAMGCHVLVEKPMAETVEECDLMISEARAAKRVLSVNHSARLDPVVVDALERVRRGECGELVAVDIVRASEYPPFGGGPFPATYLKGSYPFQDIGVHGLYLLEAFLGPIADVDIRYRSTGRHLHLQFDEWHVHAVAERGVGRLHLSWNTRPMQSRITIQGTSGVIEVDTFLQTCRSSRSLPGPKFVGMGINAVKNGAAQALEAPLNMLRFATGRLKPSPGIQRGAEEFARALLEGREPAVSAEEGRRPVALMAEACARADAERARAFAGRLGPLGLADVLVTGATGLVGRVLLDRLVADRQRVRILARRRPDWLAQFPSVDAVYGDLGDPELVAHAMRGIRTVFHLGATMRGVALDFQAGTIWGTRNVIDACLANDVERLVYVSSLSVLDHAGHPAREPIREDSPYEPFPERRGLYTQTKLQAELMVLEAVKERGLRAVLLRPGQILGLRAELTAPNGVVDLFGCWMRVGLNDPVIPLVYVDDVVDGLLLAARKPGLDGSIFNLVDPVTVTLGEYLAAVRRRPAGRKPIIRIPRALFLALSAGAALLRGSPLTPYRVRSLRPLDAFDLSAARDLLGWQPAVGVRQGLARTFPGPLSPVPPNPPRRVGVPPQERRRA